MISVIFWKLKRPSFGNMYVHCGTINLTCIVVAVDPRCVWGGGVSEEMTRVLKILLPGSEMLGLLKILMMVHRTRSGDNNRVL